MTRDKDDIIRDRSIFRKLFCVMYVAAFLSFFIHVLVGVGILAMWTIVALCVEVQLAEDLRRSI